MHNNNVILNELKDLSPAVANIDRRNVYSVPSGYFTDLADRMTAIVLQRDPILDSSITPFKVPQGYFEELSAEILLKVKQQKNVENEFEKELEEIAPLLNTISKASVYQAPDGFFERLTINKKEKATVVAFSKTRGFVRYAAAAAITGVMALGGYSYFSKQPVETTTASSFNHKEVNKLSDDEIIEYLNNNPLATEVTFSDKKVENTFEKYTKELSEEEINEYLKETSDASEIVEKEG